MNLLYKQGSNLDYSKVIIVKGIDNDKLEDN